MKNCLYGLWDFINLIPYYFSMLDERKEDMNYLEGLIYFNDALVSAKILVECATGGGGLCKKSTPNVAL